MNVKLVIDYKECELSKREIIALSYGVNRLTDIQSRQGYFSNTFRLPKTPTNLEIFGYPDQLNAVDSKRWQRLTAWIESDGVQVVYGFAQLQSVSDTIEVVVKGGNSDWIALMKDKRSEDLNLRSLDHKHQQSIIQANRFNTYTDGFIYPDIDYGWLKDEEQDPHGHFFYPAVFMHKYIEQAFADIGYTLDNALDTEERYQKMVIPFSNKERLHSDEWANDKKFKAIFGATSPPVGNLNKVDIASVEYDNGGHIDTANDYYQPNESINGQTFRLSVTYSIGTPTGTDDLTIAVGTEPTAPFTNPTPGIIIETSIASTGTFTVDFEYHFHQQPIYILAQTNNNTLTIDSGYWEVLTVDKTVVRGSEWNLAVNLPDLLQTDVLKYVANAFNVLISANAATKVATITPFDDVAANSPEDWSEKIDLSEDALISFEYGDYQAENELEYDINTDDTYLKEFPDLGKSTLLNTNKDEGKKTIYKAPFSLCQRGITLKDTLTKALIDYNETISNYTTIFYKSTMTITAINTSGVVTVASGANQLLPGVGVHMTSISGALLNNGDFIGDTVQIVSKINSDTEFQLEGSFSGSPVVSGNCRAGVMVDGNNQTFVNVLDEMTTVDDLDEVYFYGLDGSPTYTSLAYGLSSMNGNVRFMVAQKVSTRCFYLGHILSYTDENDPFPYAAPTITNASAVTLGSVRFVKKQDNKESAPRIGIVDVSTDAPNAITLYGETTETQVSELSYDDITWDVLVAAYWNTLSSIIQSPQMVKVLMRLSALDIHGADFTKPKYLSQFGCLFYLSYIEQFKTNQVDSTEVELVKLP